MNTYKPRRGFSSSRGRGDASLDKDSFRRAHFTGKMQTSTRVERDGFSPRGGRDQGFSGGSSSRGSSYGSRSSGGFGSRRSSSGGGFGGGRGQGFGGGFRGRGSRSRRPVDKIDYAKFIYKPTGPQEKIVHETTHVFADFKFNDIINRNLAERSYVTPTPIQDQTIMHALAGKDIIGLASTGSGKTAAFLLPLIEKLYHNKSEQVLVLAPTRELANQINEELRLFSHGMRLFSTVCVGGMPIMQQIHHLRRMNHIVIGTPGRLKDLADRGVIDFSTFTNVVVDEFDHMLDLGFIDQITEILKELPENRQSLFFSATMPDRIKQLVHTFLKDPIMVNIGSGISTKNVEQDIVRVPDNSKKFDQLYDLLVAEEPEKTIIFVETKREVEELYKKLRERDVHVSYIHGDKKQRERTRTLRMFKEGAVDVLIATDVAARGIDIKDISHVINYTIPQTHDDYVHRIGRTGRASRTGKAFTFVPSR